MSTPPDAAPAGIRLIPLRDVMLYAPVFRRGRFNLDLYAPRKRDYQQAHDHDELYFVVDGGGWFVNGARRHRFGAGDCVFVPAGVEHRFETFDDNLRTWVIFWGPSGGEAEPPWPPQADPGRRWYWQSGDDGEPARFDHGSLSLDRITAPGAPSNDRDAVFVVDQGRLRVDHAGGRLSAGPGDALFVPAGLDHAWVPRAARFGAWQARFGPPGGESVP